MDFPLSLLKPRHSISPCIYSLNTLNWSNIDKTSCNIHKPCILYMVRNLINKIIVETTNLYAYIMKFLFKHSLQFIFNNSF